MPLAALYFLPGIFFRHVPSSQGQNSVIVVGVRVPL